jgi:uroporphyrinogen-III synthase
VRDLGRYAAVAFTSPRSAQAFAERVALLGGAGTLSGAGAATEIWAAGAGTAQALGGTLGEVRRPDEREVGKRGAAAALASAIAAALLGAASRPVLFPCGDIRRDELPSRLRDDGIAVEEVVCYRSVLAGESDARRAAQRVEIVVVASPSVADLLARACPPGVRPALLAVGPTTAAAARSSGWPPAGVAKRPTTEALVAGVRALVLAR